MQDALRYLPWEGPRYNCSCNVLKLVMICVPGQCFGVGGDQLRWIPENSPGGILRGAEPPAPTVISRSSLQSPGVQNRWRTHGGAPAMFPTKTALHEAQVSPLRARRLWHAGGSSTASNNPRQYLGTRGNELLLLLLLLLLLHPPRYEFPCEVCGGAEVVVGNIMGRSVGKLGFGAGTDRGAAMPPRRAGSAEKDT